jgi:hypothetical protein
MAAIAATVPAAEPGQQAPELDGVTWLHAGQRKVAFRGKVTVLVFWSSNPQSTMAFPGLQDLHEVCEEMQVVTVACDGEEKAREFLDGHDYTLVAGVDSGMTTRTWAVKAWPQAFVVDRKGKVTWRGDPFRVIAAAWQEVGTDPAPEALLKALAVARRKDDLRALLDMLAVLGPVRYDFAKLAGTGAGTPAPDPGAALAAWVEGREEALAGLRGVVGFNLAAWARARRAEAFPQAVADLKRLLATRRYRTLLDALVERAPAPVAAAAARDRDFAAYCARRAADRLVHAKKALMAYHWPIQGKVPADNDAFWREISVQSWQEDGEKRMSGIQIGSQYVDGPEMEAFALRCAAQSILMEAAGKRQGPPADLAGLATAEVKRILDELKRRYG